MYLGGDFHRVRDLVAQIRTGGGDGGLVTSVEGLILLQDGFVRSGLGRLESAAATYPQNPTIQGILGYAYGILGEERKARDSFARLARCFEATRKSSGYALALVCLGLDERQDAISWLESAYAEGTLWSLGFRSDPMLRPLKGDPRFERLVSRIGSTNSFPTFTTHPGHRGRPVLTGSLAVGDR
jgi:hypothetical protein